MTWWLAFLVWLFALVISLALFVVRVPAEGIPAVIYLVLAVLIMGRVLDLVFER